MMESWTNISTAAAAEAVSIPGEPDENVYHTYSKCYDGPQSHGLSECARDGHDYGLLRVTDIAIT